MAGHGPEHGGGDHGDHGKEKGKQGWVRKLFSIVTLSALTLFAADLAKPFTLDAVNNLVTSGVGFRKAGGGGHAAHGSASHGGGHGGH